MKKIFTIEIVFVFIYFIEQVLLVILSNIDALQDQVKLMIGLFPIIFLSTLACEKLFLKEYYEQKFDKFFRIDSKKEHVESKYEADETTLKLERQKALSSI